MVPDGPPVDRVAVPADGPSRGPAGAKVTIVEFSDFQCPFCGRAVATLRELTDAYPNDVRIVFRHNPLPFHKDAPLAAEAAVAAGAQGKFWEMHDLLFAEQRDLSRAAMERHATELGLDMAKFRAALDNHAGQSRVDADLALGKKIGVTGTPIFFIDGRSVLGAQPLDVFKTIVDDEIARADSLLRRGLPPANLYATLLAGAQPALPRSGPSPFGTTVYRVPTGDSQRRGGAQPKVVIVEFADFQCPFCARAEATLGELLRTYGADLALVYRHNPLPFHQNARIAALAAEAARAQGKFWEMHDKLFAGFTDLSRPALDRYAAEIGLDLPRFQTSMDGESGADRIKSDQEVADRFGARGTPSFFINGRQLNGAQPIDVFKSAIDEELRKANLALAAGAPRADLYATLTKNGLERTTLPPPAGPKPEPVPDARYRIDIAGAPVRGPQDAPITIVEWADFQCPFCARAEETLRQVAAAYPGKVRFVWRDMPLEFHDQAEPAAYAARAARAQGKFWAMHDRLYDRPEAEPLGRATYEKLAAELGLDMKRFRAALDAQADKPALRADVQAGAKAGVTGTPTFFVNGKEIIGAQPFESFQAFIDAELKVTAALVANGTPRAGVYAALMKTADVPSPPPAGPGGDTVNDDAEDPDPVTDTAVYPVKPGDGPTKGPADAALTVVVFSDFQCPFCKRVEPTLAELQREYGAKVRLVWKNYPLPFHQYAESAAEAALAAGAQGKFWEMHDKLFENSTALERANLEKYAADLGLDLARFKADLDGHRYSARIDADVHEAAGLGVMATPVVFINGHKIPGAFPIQTFETIADAELAKRAGKTAAKVARRKGAEPAAPR